MHKIIDLIQPFVLTFYFHFVKKTIVVVVVVVVVIVVISVSRQVYIINMYGRGECNKITE